MMLLRCQAERVTRQREKKEEHELPAREAEERGDHGLSV